MLSIAEREVVTALIDLLEVSDHHRNDWLFTQLMIFDFHKKEKQAVSVLERLNIVEASPRSLSFIARVAYRNERWDLFIPAAERLLEADLSPDYKTNLQGQLAFAYFERGDDTRASSFAERALDHGQWLADENSESLLHILASAYASRGMVDKACEQFEHFKDIKRSFSLMLEEARLYLRSTISDRDDRALSLIVQAFEEADSYSDEMYLAAIMPLIELSNAGKISSVSEPDVVDGLFIEISGFTDGWFYIGDKQKSLGVRHIQPGSPFYAAVIHKAVGAEIEWPADRYSIPKRTRRIQKIVSPPAFLTDKAHEIMNQEAQAGTGLMSYFQTETREDGTSNLDTIRDFLRERSRFNTELFEMYTSQPLPFAFLCTSEGGIIQAIGRIATSNTGFIRINDSTTNDIHAQRLFAAEVLNGKTCHIDGLATLLLSEAKLLQTVTENVPNIVVSTSIIKLLRQIASELQPPGNSVGRLGLVDDELRFSPSNPEQDDAFRKQLLASADLLDELPSKVIGKAYSGPDGEASLDKIVPSYFADAFWYAQTNADYLLTDDALLVKAYGLSGVSSLPTHFSSLSLIRELAERKLIDWNSYLHFFSLLALYRCHFLPIFVDEMFQTAFPSTQGGLIVPSIRNLSLLRLDLTLSEEYGVKRTTAASVLSNFYIKVILDDAIPPEMADELFALTIKQGLRGTDKRKMVRLVQQACDQRIRGLNWVSGNTTKKFDSLNKQLLGFANGIDPIVVASPLLLRNRL
ncbi:MAG: hypothetical protein IPK52_19665 [Chloroflexi bacterium]|nr:hypothetical protein [Chloroflexota bacterium]